MTPKKKQTELPGMPKVPPVYSDGARYLELWEAVKDARKAFQEYKPTMMQSMKLASKAAIPLKDSDAVKRSIVYVSAKENIKIEKGKDFEKVGP